MVENQDLLKCGKSLGGHMRSHVIATSSSELYEQKFEMKKIPSLKMKGREMKKFQSFKMKDGEMKKIPSLEMKDGEFGLGENSGYGLRENPRKTWRAVDTTQQPMTHEKVCKQCGKVFQSIKALCGHMACHSEKEKLKDMHSDANSETEAEEQRRPVRNKSSTRPKRYKKITQTTCSFTLPNDVVNAAGSESVSEILEQDQQEVAKCLMMLSRDSGNWNGVNSFVESSDHNSVVLETKSSSIDMKTPKNLSPKTRKIEDIVDAEDLESESSDSMYFLGENKMAESEFSVEKGYVQSRTGSKEYDYYDFAVASNPGKHVSKRKTKESSCGPEYKTGSCKKIKLGFSDTKKKKYECLNCKKIFSSYQALGGHRPCHKRTFEPRNETGENFLDADNTYNTYINGDNHRESFSIRKSNADYLETKIKTKKAKGHECPFCHRIFKSGQALGGHKRSHFINRAEENGHRTQVIKEVVPNLLDLNVAPIEDENDEQFMW